MITEREIDKAIEDCLKDPVTGNKRTILADLIVIKDYLFGEPQQPTIPPASYSAPPTESPETIVETDCGSEFLQAVDGKKSDRVWKLMDEFVEASKILHPRMYSAFIDKIHDL